MAVFHLEMLFFPYLEMHTLPWKHSPTLSPTVSTIPYFFPWNFPHFIAIFHLQKFQFLYLEVHTGPWKQCPTLSPTVSTIPYFFPWKFPHFIAVFHLQKFPFSYLEVHTGSWKQCPTFSPTVSNHHWAHQCTLQPCPINKSDATGAKKMTSFLLESFFLRLGPLTPLQARKIYPYHICFTKYILRPCQPKNIFLRCDSDISGSTHQKYILTQIH